MTICPTLHARFLNMNSTLLIANDHLIPVVVLRVPSMNDCRESNFLVDLRHPLLILLRRTLASKDDIHLLKTQPLCLRHEKPDKCRTHKRQKTEKNVRSIRNVLEEIWRNLSNNEVVHPITGAAKRSPVWTRADGPDLGNQDPSARSPRVPEVDDEEPDHDYSGPACALRVVKIVNVLGEDDGDDYVGYTHTDGTDGKDGLTADAVNVEYSGD